MNFIAKGLFLPIDKVAAHMCSALVFIEFHR